MNTVDISIEELVAIVSGEQESDRRDFAVEILKYVAQQRAAVSGQPEIEKRATDMVLEIRVWSLWNGSTCLKTVGDQLVVEDVKPIQPESTPAPGPTFAVPFPVIPPSTFEQQIVKESFQTLEQKYSPEAVEARLREIEIEAKELRRLRNNPLASVDPTPVMLPPPVLPSDAERDAIVNYQPKPLDPAEIARLQTPRELSSVEKIEVDVAQGKSVAEKHADALRNLERLRALVTSAETE